VAAGGAAGVWGRIKSMFSPPPPPSSPAAATAARPRTAAGAEAHAKADSAKADSAKADTKAAAKADTKAAAKAEATTAGAGADAKLTKPTARPSKPSAAAPGWDGGWQWEADTALDRWRCDIETVHAADLSPSRFVRDYLLPNVPVKVTGNLTRGWRAWTAWSRERLEAEYGHVRATVGGLPGRHGKAVVGWVVAATRSAAGRSMCCSRRVLVALGAVVRGELWHYT
jgi:hypothetical protein